MLKDLIKKARNDLGLTQSQVALLLGSTQEKVSNWESGVIPASESLIKLCIALDITMIEAANAIKEVGSKMDIYEKNRLFWHHNGVTDIKFKELTKRELVKIIQELI